MRGGGREDTKDGVQGERVLIASGALDRRGFRGAYDVTTAGPWHVPERRGHGRTEAHRLSRTWASVAYALQVESSTCLRSLDRAGGHVTLMDIFNLMAVRTAVYDYDVAGGPSNCTPALTSSS